MICGGIVLLALIANYWQIHQPVTLEWVPTLLGFPLVALSCTLILVAILGISARLPRFLLYLGKISYGLYIYQVLGNLLSNRVIPVHALFLQLALRPLLALAITILLASASYAFLETPFLKLKKRFTHVKSRPI
jgi:peptidoglycan/LPS O-acetylase OafA/YrhL